MPRIHKDVTHPQTILRALASTFRIPKRATLSEWAAQHFHLPPVSAEPGLWRPESAPYQAGILDALSDPTVSDLWLMMSAQTGKSTLLQIITAYYVVHRPSPILWIWPTDELATEFLDERFLPTVEHSPALRAVWPTGLKTGRNRADWKGFDGGFLAVTGAQRGAGLAGKAIRVVVGDEIDRWPTKIPGEGSPIDLARRRTETYSDAVHVWCSTPTLEGMSHIETGYNQSDKRVYQVPCLNCGDMDELLWPRVLFEDKRPETAMLGCSNCGERFGQGDVSEMVQRGEWSATSSAGREGHLGFKINSLASSWVTMESMVEEFLRTKNEPDQFQVFVNTRLAETWKGDEVLELEAQVIEEKTAVSSRADLPDWALVLTMAVDVQANRLECYVAAWGTGERQHGVERIVLGGDTTVDSMWKVDLMALRQRVWKRRDGREFKIAICVVDGGYHTAQVKSAALRSKGWMRVVRGQGVSNRTGELVKRLSSKKPKDLLERAIFDGVDVWGVDVNAIKSIMFRRLLRPAKSLAGSLTFERDKFEGEWFEQMAAERQVRRIERGRPVVRWEVVAKSRRNEALDLVVYSYAAIRLLGVSWGKLAKRCEFNVSAVDEPQAVDEIVLAPQQQALPVRRTKSRRRLNAEERKRLSRAF